jgi:hypothetical protein
MIVHITSDAEADVAEGYWFYEHPAAGLGDYFRDCVLADIDSLMFYGGIHEVTHGYHRMLTKTFPFTIYYRLLDEDMIVVAVLDARRDPSWIRKRLS